MGLLYVFPVSLEEKDFAEVKDQTLTLKTYGLPYIFWGYATAILMIIFFMFLAIKAPVLKLASLGDETDAFLGYSLLSLIGISPIVLFSFFFYEKRIVKKANALILEYRIFAIKVFSEHYIPAEKDTYTIEPFLSSPNQARINGGDDGAGFQNKGYFKLSLKTQDGKNILIDRHSRKADLVKLSELLNTIP
ncbi:MAG: hypothetical protein H0V66_03165 [Bdellovibrionales bacterium]|nr:hypothetical protein [Bdellovibrionales bacterium]